MRIKSHMSQLKYLLEQHFLPHRLRDWTAAAPVRSVFENDSTSATDCRPDRRSLFSTFFFKFSHTSSLQHSPHTRFPWPSVSEFKHWCLPTKPKTDQYPLASNNVLHSEHLALPDWSYYLEVQGRLVKTSLVWYLRGNSGVTRSLQMMSKDLLLLGVL